MLDLRNPIALNKDQTFFLYYAFHQPHVPRLPGPRFRSATTLGVRGDVIVEMDWCVGEMLDALERLGIKENSIIIFSSDSGPVLDDGYEDQAEELKGTHKAAGPLRGGKYSMFDGGTRVPFILSWPSTVEAGESEAIVSHVDFHASFAAMTNQRLSMNEAPDSIDVLDALLGKSEKGCEELVIEGTQAKTVLRKDEWVYIPPHDGPAVNVNKNTELGNSPDPQLYNLCLDIGQIKNVATEHGDIVSKMSARLDTILESERTRPIELEAGKSNKPDAGDDK